MKCCMLQTNVDDDDWEYEEITLERVSVAYVCAFLCVWKALQTDPSPGKVPEFGPEVSALSRTVVNELRRKTCEMNLLIS